MKKRWFLLCAALLILFSLSVSAAAVQTDAQLPYVYDAAQLLSDEQKADLEQRAENFTELYGCGIYIVTVDDFTRYSDSYSIESFAEQVYRSYTLGVGEDDTGIMLILSMAERDYDLCAYGADAHTAFTDYGKDVLANRFLDDFRNDDWYAGFVDYQNGCASLLRQAAAGTPLDYDTDPARLETQKRFKLGVVIVVPLLIALICVLIRYRRLAAASSGTHSLRTCFIKWAIRRGA